LGTKKLPPARSSAPQKHPTPGLNSIPKLRLSQMLLVKLVRQQKIKTSKEKQQRRDRGTNRILIFLPSTFKKMNLMSSPPHTREVP
jgi:hypothetical protein